MPPSLLPTTQQENGGASAPSCQRRGPAMRITTGPPSNPAHRAARPSPALRPAPASFPPYGRLGAPLEWLAGADGVEPLADRRGVVGRELEAQEPPVQLLGRHQGRPAAAERVEHDVAGVRTRADDPTQELLGHLATVPAGP